MYIRQTSESKLISLEEGASWIEDGDLIGLGGNVLHRSPSAFVRELARQSKKNLEVVKTAGAYDIDLLAATGCLSAVSAGFVGYENEFGLCKHYRTQVEAGTIEAKEHACYTVITALRAATYGVSFLPVNGLQGSELPAQRGFLTVKDPYSDESYVAIPKIQPKWTILHVHEADEQGNAKIIGPQFEDILLAKAADHVILTAEKIVRPNYFEQNPSDIQIAGFMVKGVIHAPKGAWPASCAGLYEIDGREVNRFIACQTPLNIAQYVAGLSQRDHRKWHRV